MMRAAGTISAQRGVQSSYLRARFWKCARVHILRCNTIRIA